MTQTRGLKRSEILEVLIVLARELIRVRLSFAVILRVQVEALGVSREAHLRYYWWGDFPLEKRVPVDPLKEWMGFDGIGIAADITEPA